MNLTDILTRLAALADEESIDTVLSLGFATPEHASVFLGNLDVLEESARKLSELTIACRLGLPDVPEAAATRAMLGLDKVIEGLKALEIRMGQAEATV